MSLDQIIARLQSIMASTDQAGWDRVLADKRTQLEREAVAGARAILALFDPPASFGDVVCTKGGVAYTQPASKEREEAFEFSRLRFELYLKALALWNALDPPLEQPSDHAALEVTNYGGGNEIWRSGGRFLARYDVGAHFSLWREDEVSAAEARQGDLGARHFHFMVLELQKRLTAKGIDPYTGSAMPLPAPANRTSMADSLAAPEITERGKS